MTATLVIKTALYIISAWSVIGILDRLIRDFRIRAKMWTAALELNKKLIEKEIPEDQTSAHVLAQAIERSFQAHERSDNLFSAVLHLCTIIAASAGLLLVEVFL